MLPTNPEHRTEAVDALWNEVQANPHLETPRLILADAMEDAGAPGHETALQRFIARPDGTHRDGLIAAHGGRVSDAALATTRYAHERTRQLFREMPEMWGLPDDQSVSPPTEDTHRASREAYHAAEDIPTAGKRDRHRRAAGIHRAEQSAYTHLATNPAAHPPYTPGELAGAHELATLHAAALAMHQHAARTATERA